MLRRSRYLSSSSALPSAIACQFLWYNKNIKIRNESIYIYEFSEKGLNFVGHFFDTQGNFKSWDCLKEQFSLPNHLKYRWFQIKHAIPNDWKQNLKMHNGNISNLLIENHHLIKKNHIYCLSKLDSRELYQIQITLKGAKVTSQTYYEKCFSNFKLDWKKIYLLKTSFYRYYVTSVSI